MKIPPSIKINAGTTVNDSSSPATKVEMKIASNGTRYAKFAVKAVFVVFANANAQVKYAPASIKIPSHNKPKNFPCR